MPPMSPCDASQASQPPSSSGRSRIAIARASASSSARGSGSSVGGNGNGTDARSRSPRGCGAADEADALARSKETSTCDFCQRTSLDPNPCPNRHPGKYRRFASTRQCLPCRNYLNCKKAMKPSEVKEKLHDPKNREAFVNCVDAHSKMWDSVSGQIRGNDERITTPTWVTCEEEDALEGRQILGVFWPENVLKREDVKFEPGDLTKYDGELGMYRSRAFGEPDGTIVVSRLRAKRYKRGTDLANTSAGLTSDDVNDAWGAVQKISNSVQVKTVQVEGKEDRIDVSMGVEAQADADDSDDSSWGRCMRPHIGFAEQDSEDKDKGKGEKKKKGKRRGSARGKPGNSSAKARRGIPESTV